MLRYLSPARGTARAPQPTVSLPWVRIKSSFGGLATFRIAFAKEPGSLTVAYSDSDKGKRQKRLTATSRILLKDPLSLGVIAAERRGRE